MAGTGAESGKSEEDSRGVSSVLMFALLVLCCPARLLLMWFNDVRRGDGSAWSIGLRVAYTLAFVLPLGIVILIGERDPALRGGQTGWPFVAISLVGLIAAIDAFRHRRER